MATLSIDKVVKGKSCCANINFQSFPNVASAYVRIQPELFGMFFLKRNEAGNGYQILDPTYPAVIAPANAVPTNEPGLDRTQVYWPPVDEDRRLALRVLRSAQTDHATELLRQSAKDKDVVVKMKGWAHLGAAQFMTSGHYRSLKIKANNRQFTL